jgi:hypothetical protein
MIRRKLLSIPVWFLLSILSGGCLEFGVPSESDLRRDRDPRIQAAGASAEATDRHNRAEEIRLRAMNASDPAAMDEAILLRPYEPYIRLSKAVLQIENGQSAEGSIAQAWYIIEKQQEQDILRQPPYDTLVYQYADALGSHLRRLRENGKAETAGYGRVRDEYCDFLEEESLGESGYCP